MNSVLMGDKKIGVFLYLTICNVSEVYWVKRLVLAELVWAGIYTIGN